MTSPSLKIGLLGLLGLALSCGAFAQELTPEDTDLAPVSKAIAAVVRSDPKWRNCANCQKCSLVGKAIDLAKSGVKDTDFVTTGESCGCADGLCPLWVVKGTKVLLSDAAGSLIVGRTVRNGLPEVVTDASTSNKEEMRRFEFDGTKYTQAPITALDK